MLSIADVVQQGYGRDASDIHCVAGERVRFRIHGKLMACTEVVSHDAMNAFVQDIVSSGDYLLKGERDVSFDHPAGIRSRIHIYYQMGLPSLAIRLFPKQIPCPEELNIPNAVLNWMQKESGLVLVVGPTGSGKSTTIASLIHHVNQHRALRIVTLEDPIEYVHISNHAMISQREVGVDTASFAEGVRAALRQDPDMMMIGELRDQETIQAAIRAAEAGRMVLGTLHTSRAMTAIQRVVDVFSEDKQALVRSQLATSLRGIVSQRLIPSVDSMRREARFEILVNTPAVANLIRSNQMHQIESLMQTGSIHGMQTFGEEYAHG